MVYHFRKFFFLVLIFWGCNSETKTAKKSQTKSDTAGAIIHSADPEKNNDPFDTAEYAKKYEALSNGDSTGKWLLNHTIPSNKPLLPFNRIVAYYGNFYSKGMGILGELPEKEMLQRLQQEVDKWKAADSTMPVIPAIHYIAVTAQVAPGDGGKYRLRMPASQIDYALEVAKKINAILFIDIQIGLSTLQAELPALEKYLSMPNVHLGIDPEFSMKSGARPGKEIGTFDASDINYTQDYLAELVKKNNLPPKILVIHRFTQGMVTNYQKINDNPSVQVVMDMDGWGFSAKKINTYQRFIFNEPVEYAGFKIFYKNDIRGQGEKEVMQPKQLLQLTPKPVYIQYQ